MRKLRLVAVLVVVGSRLKVSYIPVLTKSSKESQFSMEKFIQTISPQRNNKDSCIIIIIFFLI